MAAWGSGQSDRRGRVLRYDFAAILGVSAVLVGVIAASLV